MKWSQTELATIDVIGKFAEENSLEDVKDVLSTVDGKSLYRIIISIAYLKGYKPRVRYFTGSSRIALIFSNGDDKTELVYIVNSKVADTIEEAKIHTGEFLDRLELSKGIRQWLSQAEVKLIK